MTEALVTPKQLTRTEEDRMFLGVCGGIARYIDADPSVVRVGYILLSVFSAGFPGILVYFLLALIMPEGE